jgi:hypothetical protein
MISSNTAVEPSTVCANAGKLMAFSRQMKEQITNGFLMVDHPGGERPIG